MLGKGLLLKTTALVVFFLWLVKSEKFINSRIVDHLEKCGYFFISTMVLGLLDQLQIFLQLYLVELPGVLADVGLLEL